MPSDRTDFLRDYYRLLADDISRSEATVPKVCGIEIIVMGLVLFVRWHDGPAYFAVLLGLFTITWAMHALLNANLWARRSHLMAANVELEFLLREDMDVLLPRAYYVDAHSYRYRRVFRSAIVLSFCFFLMALASVPLTLNLRTSLTLAIAVLLLWSVYVESRNCAREYQYLSAHAPGRNKEVCD